MQVRGESETLRRKKHAKSCRETSKEKLARKLLKGAERAGTVVAIASSLPAESLARNLHNCKKHASQILAPELQGVQAACQPEVEAGLARFLQGVPLPRGVAGQRPANGKE